MIRIRARLITFGKPDAQGNLFKPPVDLSSVKEDVSCDFGPLKVGKIIEITQDPEKVEGILDVLPAYWDKVPVMRFSIPTSAIDEDGRPEGGTWQQITIFEVSMVERDQALLPADFEMEILERP